MFLSRAVARRPAFPRLQAWRGMAYHQLGRNGAPRGWSCQKPEGDGPQKGRPGDAGVRKPARMVHRRSGHHGGGLRHRADLHHQYRARSSAHPRQQPVARGDRFDMPSWPSRCCRGDAFVRMRICDRHGAAKAQRGQQKASSIGPIWCRAPTPMLPRDRWKRGWRSVGRNELACLIYTSGTGGAPRGVMLHHGSILQTSTARRACCARISGWERGLPLLPAAEPRL
jgi:hypothetical protein